MLSNPLTQSRRPTRISVADVVTHTMAEGLGFNWYACYDDDIYPAADDEARWERVFRHADWLNMQFIRFGQSAAKLSDGAGNFIPTDASFGQLRRVDAWAQRRGATLLLDPFAIPDVFRFPPSGKTEAMWGFSMAPRDIDAYVRRFIIPYVSHVVRDLGCRSVRWFNHVNEPFGGGAYSTPAGVDQHRHYVEVVKAIRQGLDEAGLNDIGQLGPDCHDHRIWPVPEMVAKGADPDQHLAGYCLHNYHSRFDWAGDSDNLKDGTDTISTLMNQAVGPVIAYAHQRRKPFFITEIGTFYYGWKWGDPAGIARHDNVLGELEFILRSVNLGCDGALRWAWLNSGRHDGWWQLLDTLSGKDRPLPDPYYGYGTLYRHVGRNAAVLECAVTPGPEQDRTVHALAVHNTDGSGCLCLINDSYANPVAVEVLMPVERGATLRRIATDHVRKYQESDDFHADTTGTPAQWRDVLSPMSLTVYTTSELT